MGQFSHEAEYFLLREVCLTSPEHVQDTPVPQSPLLLATKTKSIVKATKPRCNCYKQYSITATPLGMHQQSSPVCPQTLLLLCCALIKSSLNQCGQNFSSPYTPVGLMSFTKSPAHSLLCSLELILYTMLQNDSIMQSSVDCSQQVKYSGEQKHETPRAMTCVDAKNSGGQRLGDRWSGMMIS